MLKLGLSLNEDLKLRCECGSEIIIQYGKTSAGRQRFKCTECNKTFIEKREIYTRTEKRLLSMLIEFLDFESGEDFNFKDFVKLSRKEYHHGSGKVIIERVYDASKFDISKAKAIICKEADKISIYEVKEDVLKDLENNRRAVKERSIYSYKSKKEEYDNFCV